MIKKGAELICHNCKEVTARAQRDLNFGDRVIEGDILKPDGNLFTCGEFVKCFKCGADQNFIMPDHWKNPDD